MRDASPKGHPHKRLMIVLIVATVAAILVGVPIGFLTGSGPRPQRNSHLHFKELAKVTDPIDLPSGYGPPLDITTSSSPVGVWFLDSGGGNESVFSWDPTTESLKTYPFADSSDPLPFGDQAGITVDTSGTVWVGIDMTLIRVDPKTGTVKRISIPSVGTDPSLQGGPGGVGGVPRLYTSHTITQVIAEPNGDIAITISFSTTIFQYDPTSAVFTPTQLPQGIVPNAIGMLPNTSRLVVAGNDGGNVFTVSPSGSLAETNIAGVYGLGCGGDACATVASPHSVAELMATSSSAFGIRETSTNYTTTEIQIGSAPIPFGDSGLVAATRTGIAVLDPVTHTSHSFVLPKKSCSTATSGAVPPPRNGSEVPSGPKTCQESPTDIAVDSQGNIWYSTNFSTSAVFEMSGTSG